MTSFLPSKAAIANATASNASFHPTKCPVGLFLGGTSGIGRAMAEQFARQTNGCAQIILLGRNEEAANDIIACLPTSPASAPPEEASKYSFIKVDVTSMAQVRQVTSQLQSELNKINFIVTSTGYFTIQGRNETSEGIDRSLACSFYARFRFIHDLVPLVNKAAEKGEQTGIISIFSAGKNAPIDFNDLGLVKSYGPRKAATQASAYTDAAFEELAKRYPKLGFYHIFPGLVSTPLVTKQFWFPISRPLLNWMIVSPAQCAEVMWWRAWSTDPEFQTGAHQINNRGVPITPANILSPEQRKMLWDHAVKMTG